MMRFRLLLFILASKFKKAAEKGQGFDKLLMGHECTIVIKTNDGQKGRRFIFKDGGFATDSVLDQFDAALVWTDAKTAFQAMRRGDKGIRDALQNHLVAIEGKLHSFTWFRAAIGFVAE
jgi:hypothetical protein